MTSEQVQGWLQILGMLGVIASLLFVGAQFNQAQKIANFIGYYMPHRSSIPMPTRLLRCSNPRWFLVSSF